jgi:methylphosphotriester-DNA--protein-cysteine methyltransferase
MTSHSTVHITKLAAAERQLRAAIRLFFVREDGLAVHTVAAAAYQLLADLKAKRGMSEAADTHLTSIFYAVRSFRRGTLPKSMTDNSAVMAEIERLAALLPIMADSQISDVSVSIGADDEKRYWNARHKTANFLKHAERDSDDVLVEDAVDNANLLMLALGAYLDLLHRQLLPEGLVLWLYVCVRDDDSSSVPEKFQRTLAVLASLDEDERYEFCAAMIKRLSERPGAA